MKKNKVIEPVKVEKDTRAWHKDAMRYSHPSYGQVRFARISGTRSSMFGSKIECRNFIELEISESECTQDLGVEWYHSKKPITRVAFSSTQFAELLTNMNTEGVPCTIAYRADLGHIEYAEMPRELEYIKDAIQKKVDNHKIKREQITAEMNELLTRTGTLKKVDKERLITLTRLLNSTATESLPFYAKSAQETIDKATQEAKAELSAFELHAVTTLGMKALNNPELLTKLLE